MPHDAFSLDGSTAIVTGGSRGIGEAIAIAMADAGAAVAAVARSEDDLVGTVERIEERGGSAIRRTVDVTDEAAVAELFEDVASSFGQPSVLVNNAGINPYFGDAREADRDSWDSIMSVNATGTFTCARDFARHVTDRDDSGVIVNVGSVGSVVGLPYQTPYTASKHAIAGMTKSMAAEWAPDVRVNAVAPGYVKTALTEGVRGNESIRDEVLSDIPMDRFAEPEEIASTVVYLASDAAAYATGEIHTVDGGMTAV